MVMISYISIANSPPRASSNLEFSTLLNLSPPADELVVAVPVADVVLEVGLEVVLEVDPLDLETDAHSLSTLDDTFSGAVWQYAT